MGCVLFLGGGRLQACVSLYFGRGVYLMGVGVPNKKKRSEVSLYFSFDLFIYLIETDKSESAGTPKPNNKGFGVH